MKIPKLLLLLMLISVYMVRSGTINVDVDITPDNYKTTKYGVFTKEELTLLQPQNQPSFTFNLTFTSPVHPQNGFVEVLIYNHLIQPYIGYTYSPLNHYYCCTEGLVHSGVCYNVNSLIYFYPTGSAGMNYSYYYKQPVSNFSRTYTISTPMTQVNYSGIWTVIIANCHAANRFAVKGTVTWQNPYGHLPAQIFAFVPFFWMLFTFYVLLTVIWLYRFFKHRRTVNTVQVTCAVLIVIATFASLWWGLCYSSYNTYGILSPFVVGMGSTFTALELTFVRLIVLLLANGYTITEISLDTKSKTGVFLITIVYFFSATVCIYSESLHNVGLPVDDFLWDFCVAILWLSNIVFVFWAAFSAFITVSSLRKIEQTDKHTVYNNWMMVLIGGLIVSVLFTFSQLFIKLADGESDAFSVWWIFTAYWELIYFLVILYNAMLLNPTRNNMRYTVDPSDSIRLEIFTKKKKNIINYLDDDDDDDFYNRRPPIPINDEESSYTTSKEESEDKNQKIIQDPTTQKNNTNTTESTTQSNQVTNPIIDPTINTNTQVNPIIDPTINVNNNTQVNLEDETSDTPSVDNKH